MSFRMPHSKFRHVYGEPVKKSHCYENIRISKNAHDTYFSCVNPKFLAVIIESAGGGAFQVIPLEKIGRLDMDWGKVSGHTGPVLDIKFDGFNDNVIASGSEDTTVKIWHIPDGGAREIRESLLTLEGHSRRVVQIEWHPTAENILVSAGSDQLVIVWDVGRGEGVRVIDCHQDVVCSIGFSWTGDMMATTCRDMQIRLIEPRMATVAQVTPGHSGTRSSKLAFCTNKRKIFTTGFSKFSERQYALWDVKNMSQPLKMEVLDASSGVVFPFYDPDLSVLYLAGRGDGNIRYYEMVDTFQHISYLNQFQSASPQRSLCAMPKRGLNVKGCEIARFYKLYATKNFVEPISMIVPRRGGPLKNPFQEDIYPDTVAPTPAMATEDWLNGANAAPVMISLKTNSSLKTNKPVHYKASENQLITSDRNNELKFRFIASDNSIDYRPLAERKYNKAEHNGGGDTDEGNRSFNDSRRSLLVESSSFTLDSSPERTNRSPKLSSGKVNPRQRYSLQEGSPATERADFLNHDIEVDNSPTMRSNLTSSRSFRKLQRIWTRRQHSVDPAIPDLPAGHTDSDHAGFPTLQEDIESMDTESTQPSSVVLEESMDADDRSRDSDMAKESRSDEENYDPNSGPSVSYMRHRFFEQQEKISQLERTVRQKEEENVRLLAELNALKEEVRARKVAEDYVKEQHESELLNKTVFFDCEPGESTTDLVLPQDTESIVI
ncbi:hypothetical protein RvY_05802 [Ramazzottius varieornatus]|uniref:Coronin n=1 Tax=Ramazzottius varieornatus TaxID=947166 RepID=A0A1D1UWB4_RAMVA|nr:hypothetical protein RvY_05802 [Ramazzottius varieornatus]